MSKHKVQVRRVYDDPARGDGNRVLVDRIWPRGMTKRKRSSTSGARRSRHPPSCARGITTTRNVSPSSPTRYHADELTQPERAEALAHRILAKDRKLTLLTASKAVDISEATVLAEMLS